MEIKKLFLAFITFLALSACSDDEKPGNEDLINGYLSLTISTPESPLRTAPGSEGTEDGSAAESAISNVTVVLTNESGVISTVVTPPMSGSNTTEPFRVPIGTHRVYALVNLPTGIALTVNESIQRVVTVATAAEATNGFSNGSFFMVNGKHEAATNAGISTIITSMNTSSSPAKVEVYVDRVAVKIVPKASPTLKVSITTNPAGFITGATLMGYTLLNVNKQFYLVQDWGIGNTNGMNIATEALQTPLYPGESALVKDQYFHNINEYAELHKVDGVITEIEDLTVEHSGFSWIEIGDTVYATENRPTIMSYGTPAKPTAGRGETTGVIYRVQAVGSEGPISTFFEYRGTLYANLADVEAASGLTLNGLANKEIRAKGVRVYAGGIMYYTYFIKGTNTNTNHKWGEGGENYYGVFRNSVYNLTVNNINRLGDDIPGGGRVSPGDPGEPGNPPIDADEAYIEVTVNVNNWVLNTIGIDF